MMVASPLALGTIRSFDAQRPNNGGLPNDLLIKMAYVSDPVKPFLLQTILLRIELIRIKERKSWFYIIS